MIKTLPFLWFLFSTFAFADNPCQRQQADIKSYLMEASSRIAFKNDGGLFNGGVCWWHSRLQRASAYLVKFAPDSNSPSQMELKKILHSLRSMDKVVTIPGYHDFATFSKDYQKDLQLFLDEWQMIDGFYNFEWIRGISGKYQLPADEMQKRMNNVFSFYQKSPSPLWVMAQMKGMTSHSLLILNMTKSADGYDLEFIDSNYPAETLTIEYHEGDNYLKTPKGRPFVPYVGFQNDFRNIMSAVNRSCGREELDDLLSIQDGEVEITYSTEQQY